MPSSLLRVAFTFGVILQIVHGAEQNPYFMNTHQATALDFDHREWSVYGTGINKVTFPGQQPVPIVTQSKSIPHQLTLKMPQLKPVCSILMNNGAQIDYIPGVAALWVPRIYSIPLRIDTIITGIFKERDLYSYSAQAFANILMHTGFVNVSRPVHVTFSNTGEFPIKHPKDIHEDVIKKWNAS